MNISIMAFGIAKDLVGGRTITFEIESGDTVSHVLERLRVSFPDLKKLDSLLVAINEEYAESSYVVQSDDELVLIPPVSGG